MDIVNFKRIKSFKLFNKWDILTTTEIYCENSMADVEDIQPIIVQVRPDYYKAEFEVKEDGDTK